MKALVGAFNQEKALIEAFSVIVKSNCETHGSLTALFLGDVAGEGAAGGVLRPLLHRPLLLLAGGLVHHHHCLLDTPDIVMLS